MEADVQRLLASKGIRRVAADPETARSEVEISRRHLASAEKIMADDPTLAFTALYDAMRKAISAHMRTRGYRVTGGPGAHMKTGATRRLPSTTSTSARISISSTRFVICETRASTMRSTPKPGKSVTLSRMCERSSRRLPVTCEAFFRYEDSERTRPTGQATPVPPMPQ